MSHPSWRKWTFLRAPLMLWIRITSLFLRLAYDIPTLLNYFANSISRYYFWHAPFLCYVPSCQRHKPNFFDHRYPWKSEALWAIGVWSSSGFRNGKQELAQHTVISATRSQPILLDSERGSIVLVLVALLAKGSLLLNVEMALRGYNNLESNYNH